MSSNIFPAGNSLRVELRKAEMVLTNPKLKTVLFDFGKYSLFADSFNIWPVDPLRKEDATGALEASKPSQDFIDSATLFEVSMFNLLISGLLFFSILILFFSIYPFYV